MRILVIGLNFHPELTGIGKYTGEMTAWLSEQGHKLRVITTPPYYPHWRISDGYSKWRYQSQKWKGIQVIRCPFWVPREPSGLKRIIHLASFSMSAVFAVLPQIFWQPNVVICVAPAFLSAPVALLAACLSKAKTWLHIQDFELDASVSLGILPLPEISAPLARWIEKYTFRRFDRVSTISPKMVEMLMEKEVSEDRAIFFPNWVDTKKIFPIEGPSSFREHLGINDNQVVVLYSGNMGRKQALEILLDSAHSLLDDPNIVFILCGDGVARKGLEQRSKVMPNVHFIPLQPADRLNELLNFGDIHALPQRAGAADLVMPSKLLGILASGRPVIAMAEEWTELGSVVKQVGLVVSPDDPSSLTSAIRKLANDPSLRRRLGVLGREFVVNKWNLDTVLKNYEVELERLFDNGFQNP